MMRRISIPKYDVTGQSAEHLVSANDAVDCLSTCHLLD